MGIDEARRHDQPVGVDGALGTLGHLADLGHLAVRDRDIGLVTRRTRAIEHGAVLDDEIVAHSLVPPGRNFTQEYTPGRAVPHAKNTGQPRPRRRVLDASLALA